MSHQESFSGSVPEMRWGNPARVHAEGNIAALRFGAEAAQYDYGAKWLRNLLGVPWIDKRGGSERGLAMSDMAVLVRTRKQMASVAAALRAAGLDVLARGESSLLIPPEAEAMATAADFLAGVRTDPPLQGGKGGPTISPVAAADVRRTAVAAGLAVTEEDAVRGVDFLAQLKASDDWNRSRCLIAVLEEYLCACGYHAAFDGESHLYPVSPTDGKDSRRRGHGRSGELAWYAISRVLSAAADFQRFGFGDALVHKVPRFARWLRIEAPLAYKGDEGGGAGDDGLRVSPDAINLLTVHGAKGLEWPAVWLPDMVEGRFPLRRYASGSKVWNILPPNALTVEQAQRANGEDGEENRLAYVSCSRAEAFLLATYGPPAGWKNPKPSPYFKEIAKHRYAVQDGRILPEAARKGSRRLEPSPKRETRTITVTFSQLFSFWVCPRAFYLRFLVGFPPPLVPELGYGESLHRGVRELHDRVRLGEILDDAALEEVALRHFHLPFADEGLTADLAAAAVRALTAYHKGYHAEEDGEVAYVEQEVRLDLGLLTLVGRIDLTTMLMNSDIVLAEVKTEEAASSEDELFAYGLGYEAGKGHLPNWVETRSIRADAVGADRPERKPMDAKTAEKTRERIRTTGEAMSSGHFPMVKEQEVRAKCRRCDVRRVCWQGQSVVMTEGSAF